MEKSKKLINIFKRIIAFFYKDLHWKILALAMAFLLWFVGVNVNDPVQIQTYSNLPLNVIGRDQLAQNQVVLLNDAQVSNTRIETEVRGIRSSLAQIQTNRTENIQASIDLSSIDFDEIFVNTSDVVSLPVDVAVAIQQDYISKTIYPPQIQLQIDRHDYRTMPITVEPIGNPREGFEQRDPILAQSMLRITGARSALNQVEEVRIRVNIDDAYETVEEMETLMVFNEAGDNITNTVTLSTQLVHVRVPIFPYISMPLELNAIGNVASGFVLTNIIIEPSTIELVGNIDEDTHAILLGDIYLDELEENKEQSFDIRQALAGTGLTIRTGAPTEATATVMIEPLITRDFTIPLNSIAVRGTNRSYSFAAQGPLRLSFRGRESVVNNLSLGQISASLDLGGLAAGTHSVNVGVAAIRDVVLVSPVSVSVRIEEESNIPEPPPDEPDYPNDEPYEPDEPDEPNELEEVENGEEEYRPEEEDEYPIEE